MVAAILLACGFFHASAHRWDHGRNAESDFHWRGCRLPRSGSWPWRQRAGGAPADSDSNEVRLPFGPRLRGPDRDGIIRGRPDCDRLVSVPPVELWRRPVGPGWSFVRSRGGHIYTRNSAVTTEVVACYNLTTGQPSGAPRRSPLLGVECRCWSARDPTLHNEQVYTFGATGILNGSRAADGAVSWSLKRRIRYRQEGPGLGLFELTAGS